MTMRWMTVTTLAMFAMGVANAQAAPVLVDTADGPTGTFVWTVTDPDVGDYTVTVATSVGGYDDGGNAGTFGDWWYRTPSGSGDNKDGVFTWTVSGLNPNAVITDFKLEETRAVGGIGSGDWDFELLLQGAGSAGLVSTTGDTTDLTGAIVTPDLMISDSSFGNAPQFSLFIDEVTAGSNRSLGTQAFTITAVLTPEPSSIVLFLLVGAIVPAYLVGRHYLRAAQQY